MWEQLWKSRSLTECTRGLFRGIAVAKRRAMKTLVPVFLIALVLALAEGLAGAQQATKVPRIGYLGLFDLNSNPSSLPSPARGEGIEPY
jgi:hypothetical protein